MTIDEVRANVGRTVTWTPPGGTPWPGCVILRIIDDDRTRDTGPRVWIRLGGYASERDVAPEELKLLEETDV